MSRVELSREIVRENQKRKSGTKRVKGDMRTIADASQKELAKLLYCKVSKYMYGSISI